MLSSLLTLPSSLSPTDNRAFIFQASAPVPSPFLFAAPLAERAEEGRAAERAERAARIAEEDRAWKRAQEERVADRAKKAAERAEKDRARERAAEGRTKRAAEEKQQANQPTAFLPTPSTSLNLPSPSRSLAAPHTTPINLAIVFGYPPHVQPNPTTFTTRVQISCPTALLPFSTPLKNMLERAYQSTIMNMPCVQRLGCHQCSQAATVLRLSTLDTRSSGMPTILMIAVPLCNSGTPCEQPVAERTREAMRGFMLQTPMIRVPQPPTRPTPIPPQPIQPAPQLSSLPTAPSSSARPNAISAPTTFPTSNLARPHHAPARRPFPFNHRAHIILKRFPAGTAS